MIHSFQCGKKILKLQVPDSTMVYESHFPDARGSSLEIVMESINNPLGCPFLEELVLTRRKGDVVIVVSDITRPIPYHAFLFQLCMLLEDSGVRKEEVLILVATGMHRPSTEKEQIEMFGKEVFERYRIVDHLAEDESDLAEVEGRSWSGAKVRLNRYYVNAGMRIITGLVEPHFMAGFSGGRKSICPGLASLDTVKNFHGEPFLSKLEASNGNLEGNPLHEESLSVAKLVPPDFSINLVLNHERQVVSAFSGNLEAAHEAACAFVRKAVCPMVEEPADVVITSSGGYPLDTTFYQCVKGMVSCLPAVKPNGKIISFGGCEQGIGGPEYEEVMRKYSGRWRDFLSDICHTGVFTKDQWQYQMHCRTLEKVTEENLLFISDLLPFEDAQKMSVHAMEKQNDSVEQTVQTLIDLCVSQNLKIAIFPEGPYCAPVSGDEKA
jgi:lactate racemase